MKQYHLTFSCYEYPETNLFYIVKAKNPIDAIKGIEQKVKLNFFEIYGKEVNYHIHSEFFELSTYPLTDAEVKELILSKPESISGETLGRLIVWFNDRELDFITSLFNNKPMLSALERCLFPCEIAVDLEKLDKLRGFIDE